MVVVLIQPCGFVVNSVAVADSFVVGCSGVWLTCCDNGLAAVFVASYLCVCVDCS